MRALLFVVITLIVLVEQAPAEIFGGVNFPDGAASFVDEVVSYDPVIQSNEPTLPFRNAATALGPPNYVGVDNGSAAVSLGDGGSITLRFVDNSLTGSGNDAFDLWIFEVGGDVEDTFVEVSTNGSTWSPVGKVFGSTRGIDIDSYGFGTSNFFSYVRLTDDPNEGGQTGVSVGADIDAVGAIASAPPVPEPSGIMIFGIGIMIAVAVWR
jgi:hypothetical protein